MITTRKVLHRITGDAMTPQFEYRWWALKDGLPVVVGATTEEEAIYQALYVVYKD